MQGILPFLGFEIMALHELTIQAIAFLSLAFVLILAIGWQIVCFWFYTAKKRKYETETSKYKAQMARYQAMRSKHLNSWLGIDEHEQKETEKGD